MNKIRVIDLLNKIVKGEEIPHFMVGDSCVEYYIDDKGFISDTYGNRAEWLIYAEWLNEEVELLNDEPKKIEPFTQEEMEIYHDMSAPIDDLVHKVSLIIDYINRGNDE